MAADQTKPNYSVTVDGALIKDDLIAALIQITVDEPLDQASMCAIRFRDEGAVLSSDHPFKVGADLEIGLGYVGAPVTNVFKGQVTGHKGAFARRSNPTFTVLGHDRFHLLRRNRRSKTFLKLKDSDAIKKVAQEAGLSAKVDATPLTQEAIFQFNQTDADFILERAAMFGYETWVEGKELRSRPPDLSAAAVATLTWHEQLRHFETRISLANQHPELTTQAWSMMEKKLITATAKKGQERSLMGGTESGAKFAGDVFKKDVQLRATVPARTQDEVQAYAEARFRQQSEAFLLGEGTCEGDPKIRRGTVVEIEEVGDHLAGPYYVRRATHTLMVESGYTTSFRVLRTAVKRPAVSIPNPERPPPHVLPDYEAPSESEPLNFEVGEPGGAPLGGAPFVVVDPSGERQDGELSSDGKVEVEFQE
ncbi:MAG: phage late control D family protein [Planctomycetes bacterium]|nr:phage late control D family protein [Planctomycetota bacterium]